MVRKKQPVGRPRQYASNAERQRAYRQRQARMRDDDAARELLPWRLRDAYAILGVRYDATMHAIKRAYKALARATHPDRHQGNLAMEARMKRINLAYDEIRRWRGQR